MTHLRSARAHHLTRSRHVSRYRGLSRPQQLRARRLAVALALAGASAVGLSACGSAPVKDDTASGQHSSSSGHGSSGASGGSVTVSSCGKEMTFTHPKRLVTLDQASTETLLALDASDQIAGVANVKTKVPDEYAEAYRKITVLNPKFLSGEQLRAANPDAVVATFSSFFTTSQVGTRDELAKVGIPSFVSGVDCPKNTPNLNAFERLANDYRDLGRITGHTAEASALIAKQHTAMKKAEATKAKLRPGTSVAFLYSAYDGQPYVAGRTSLPQAMADLVGVKNTFDDVADVWPEVQWEQLGSRNPDVIVLADLSDRGRPGDRVEDKIATLKSNPATKNLDAVKDNRFISLNGIGLDAAPRSIQALEGLAAGLEKLGYTR